MPCGPALTQGLAMVSGVSGWVFFSWKSQGAGSAVQCAAMQPSPACFVSVTCVAIEGAGA